MGYQTGDNRIFGISIGPSVYSGAAGRLSLDDDAVGISAKAVNVISDPFNSLSLVKKPHILVLVGNPRETEYVQPIVCRDKDNIFSVCDMLTAVERGIRISQGEATSMESDKHRLFGTILRLCPDIQCQAILTLRSANTTSKIFDDVGFGNTLARKR